MHEVLKTETSTTGETSNCLSSVGAEAFDAKLVKGFMRAVHGFNVIENRRDAAIAETRLNPPRQWPRTKLKFNICYDDEFLD